MFIWKKLREAYSKKDDFFYIRYKEILEILAPIFDKFKQDVKVELKNRLPKRSLGQALDYTRKIYLRWKLFYNIDL